MKLACGKDPVAEGIERQPGVWDMRVFDQHVESCPECMALVRKIRRRLEDALRKGAPSTVIITAQDMGIKA